MDRYQIVEVAKTFLGTPYSKLDCSAFVREVFRKFEYELPRVSATQAKTLYENGYATVIDKSYSPSAIANMLKIGDLLFWGNPKYPTRWMEIHHVGIYIGDGKTIESSGSGVHIASIWETSAWQIVLIADITPLLQEDDMLNKNSDPKLIAEFQQELLDVGGSLPKYGADGKWGSETDTAIIAFKTAHGLPADNIVNEYVHQSIAQEYRKQADALKSDVADAGSRLSAIVSIAQGK